MTFSKRRQGCPRGFLSAANRSAASEYLTATVPERRRWRGGRDDFRHD